LPKPRDCGSVVTSETRKFYANSQNEFTAGQRHPPELGEDGHQKVAEAMAFPGGIFPFEGMAAQLP
jgi:hypothetical protein